MTYKAGDKIKIAVHDWDGQYNGLIDYGKSGTIIGVYEYNKELWEIRMDDDPAKTQCAFHPNQIEPFNGYYRMTDPDISLDEIITFEELLK